MIAWVALGLALAGDLFLISVTVLALRAWAKVAPSVTPMLSMFAPPKAPALANTPNTTTATNVPASPTDVGPHNLL